MNSADAVHHIVVFAVDEARLLHHCEQSLLIGMHANRFDEVLIAGGIIGDYFALKFGTESKKESE